MADGEFLAGLLWYRAVVHGIFHGLAGGASLAVPFGVGAAIYVNQMASAREQRMIKPCIEFIAAFPSVVLGFFGIAVLGETLRLLSQQEWLAWVPGFPFSERLNILTAGCLLALIAVPTIFTLAEDALQNVPKAFKEASFALEPPGCRRSSASSCQRRSPASSPPCCSASGA